jgi:hypothetical protein
MHKHLQKINDHTFDKIFNQQIGFLLLKDYCNSVCDEPVPQVKFYEEVFFFFFLHLFHSILFFFLFLDKTF